MMQKAAPGFSDYVLLVLLAAIFGSSFFMTKIAVAEVPAASLVAIRLAIASVIFLVAMMWMGQRVPGWSRMWIFIFGAALFGNALPFFLISWGQEKVDAGLAAILMATMPLMTIVIAHFTTSDEKLTPWKIAGFFLGLLGVAVMIGFEKLGTLGEETVRQYAVVGGALCYAVASIITKKLVHLPRVAMMAVVMVVSTLMILPFAILDAGVFEFGSLPSFNASFAALMLGVLPTAIGTILVFAIIAGQGASFLSQINFMVPVFGVMWGMLFLAEIVPANAFIALALILAGVAIARIPSKTVSRKETKL